MNYQSTKLDYYKHVFRLTKIQEGENISYMLLWHNNNK